MINCGKLMENQVKKKMEKAQTIECSRRKMINPWNDEIIIEDQKLKEARGKLFRIINYIAKPRH